ncbi:MAG: hypothetical protein CMQ45_01315 [Gammaproteobacteria bacterium]|nr:hypothetical protein [Gammaproteobacteria bacterium]
MSSLMLGAQRWKCGEQLKVFLLSLPKYEEPRKCRSVLQAYPVCRHYGSAADTCRDDIADSTLNSYIANLCDQFTTYTNSGESQEFSAARNVQAVLTGIFRRISNYEANPNQTAQTEANHNAVKLKRPFCERG